MAERPGLLEMLGQTWPARMAKSAWEAAKLPGDVYAGRTDPLSEEGIGRSADLARMVMGGTYAGAPAGAMGAGAVKPTSNYARFRDDVTPRMRQINPAGIEYLKRDIEIARRAGDDLRVQMLERDLARAQPTSNYVMFGDDIIDIKAAGPPKTKIGRQSYGDEE